MKNIFRLVILSLCTLVLTTSCIKETFPMNGSATYDQIEDSEFASDGLSAAISAILLTNNIYGSDSHEDFGYPSIMATFDRAIGEILPTGPNQYADRFQYYHYQMSIGPTGYCAFVWYHYYQFIKIVNDMIRVCGDDESTKQQLGIAKAFRALYYLDLARFYDPLEAYSDQVTSYHE